MFSSIGTFFDFSNKESPIFQILNTITSELDKLWNTIKPIFNNLGNMGDTIWNGIKNGWDTFITGENGILSFGAKVVQGLIDFAKAPINWLVEAIKDAVIAPIQNIFSGILEDANEKADEAARDIRVEMNQKSAEEQIKQQALANSALDNSKKGANALIDTARLVKEESQKKAKEQGIKLDNKGNIDKDALKQKTIQNALIDFLKQKNLDFDNLEKEYQQNILEELSKHIVIDDSGSANIKMDEFKEAIASIKGDGWIVDSSEVDALQGISQPEVNSMESSIRASLLKRT